MFSDYVLEKIDDIEFKNISFEVILHILPQLAPSKIKILRKILKHTFKDKSKVQIYELDFASRFVI